MTARERVLAVLNRDPVDRLPVDLWHTPEVGAAISNATGYGTPNEKAAPLLARPVPFPTPEEMAKLEYIQDLGADAQAWDQLWTEIKAG